MRVNRRYREPRFFSLPSHMDTELSSSCFGCGKAVPTTKGISYTTSDGRVHWFCNRACVEMRRGYLYRYRSEGTIRPAPHTLHVYDHILRRPSPRDRGVDSDAESFREAWGTPDPSLSGAKTDADVVVERCVPCQGLDLCVERWTHSCDTKKCLPESSTHSSDVIPSANDP